MNIPQAYLWCPSIVKKMAKVHHPSFVGLVRSAFAKTMVINPTGIAVV
jgi:hypothetical protein